MFWDIADFSAHVNMRYRDEFVARIPVPGQPQPAWGLDYTTVDAQMSYNWPDLGLSVVLSANNLTDEENLVRYGVEGYLGEVRTFGRQFYLGVNYQY